MLELLFDAPWYLPLGIAIAGLGTFLWGNNRLRRDAKMTGIGLMILAAAVTLISYLVDTPGEQVSDRTRALVRAVVAKDSAAMGDLLTRDSRAFLWNRQEIIDGAMHYAQQMGLRGARIIRLDVEPDTQTISSVISVWSQHDGGKLGISDLTSQWQLLWRDDGGTWRIQEIIPLQIGQTPRQEIEQRYLQGPPR